MLREERVGNRHCPPTSSADCRLWHRSSNWTRHGAYTAGSCDCLNNVAEERGIPVFETPELSRESRVAILKRFRKEEHEVMRNLFERVRYRALMQR